MRLSELLSCPLPFPDGEVTGITCDSRRVTPGTVFVCIKGTARDGHLYAADALSAGAAAVVTEEPQGLPREITVPSTRKMWAGMCARWFGEPAKELRLIGVTGTNGKTTVTFLLKSLLESFGEKVGLIGTIQNMIGEEILPSGHTTPDPYDLQQMLRQMADAGCGWAVMEVSSHALCQDRVEGLWFEAAAFTNLTQDHLDYHGTMENYLQAKKRLFSQTSLGLFNGDDPHTPAMTEGLTCRTLTFGTAGEDIAASDITPRPDGGDFTLTFGGQTERVRFAIPGRFSVYNALTAAGCLLALGFPFPAVCAGLERAKGVKGRAEIVPCDRGYTVVIDYAHTPDGLENICRTLRECCAGRLITVFGCGGDRDRGKRPLMGQIAARWSDQVIVTSDNPRSEDPMAIIEEILTGMGQEKTPYLVEENRPAAIRLALSAARPKDTVLLAGKGHETYQVLAGGTIHLDEREIVAAVLAEEV